MVVWVFAIVCMFGGPAGAFYVGSALDRGNALAASGEPVEGQILGKRTDVSMGTAKVSEQAKTTYYLKVIYHAPRSGTVRSGEVVVPATIYNTKNIDDLIIVLVNPDSPGSPAWPEFATAKPGWIKYMIWAIGAAMTLLGGWIAYRQYTGQSLNLGGNDTE